MSDFSLTPEIVNEQIKKYWTGTPHPCIEISPTHAVTNQVINQDTDVGFAAGEGDRTSIARFASGIQTSHKTLCPGFLVACCAIDLARKK